MADVAQNAHSSNTTERNGSIVVGAPKGASNHSDKYVIEPTLNSTVDPSVLETKFSPEDPRIL